MITYKTTKFFVKRFFYFISKQIYRERKISFYSIKEINFKWDKIVGKFSSKNGFYQFKLIAFWSIRV